jgi:hypothetical protein
MHFPGLLSTVIRSWLQVKPATLLIPLNLFLFLCGGEVLQYPVPKWLFSLINVEVFSTTCAVLLFPYH